MNSLPLISHHLFAAAAAQEDRPRRKPAHNQGGGAQAGTLVPVPLELLEAAEAIVAGSAPPLQPAQSPSQS